MDIAQRHKRERGVVVLAWLALLGLGVIPPLLREAHPDIAWSLYLAGELLRGARQGVDFLEINPPLMLWLAIPPVLSEREIGITAWHANVLLTTALVCSSLASVGFPLLALLPEGGALCRYRHHGCPKLESIQP